MSKMSRSSRRAGGTPGPASTQMPSRSWLASSGPVSFSNVQWRLWPTLPLLRQREIAEVDDEVGRDPALFAPEVGRAERARSDRAAVGTAQRLEPPRQLIE